MMAQYRLQQNTGLLIINKHRENANREEQEHVRSKKNTNIKICKFEDIQVDILMFRPVTRGLHQRDDKQQIVTSHGFCLHVAITSLYTLKTY